MLASAICQAKRLFLSPQQNKLDDNTETTQAAAKQNTRRRSEKSRHAHWLNILPRNDVPEKIWRYLTGSKTKQAAQRHTSQRATGDN